MQLHRLGRVGDCCGGDRGAAPRGTQSVTRQFHTCHGIAAWLGSGPGNSLGIFPDQPSGAASHLAHPNREWPLGAGRDSMKSVSAKLAIRQLLGAVLVIVVLYWVLDRQ